ncbi:MULTISPECIES: hypothetical protein [Halomonas]|uniref:Uncharacterized protein n=1 Tax=Halomonas citrativorans TaxID=2742612 RepID=A0ABR9F9L5_9GAMM|nr:MULTISPECIES: hypothetical protein [Halomonas]MBE0403171.1 hypothetical protein [Halomonas citrativorans]
MAASPSSDTKHNANPFSEALESALEIKLMPILKQAQDPLDLLNRGKVLQEAF